MAVSVIISNMNGARFLPKLLETLTAQEGVETEIIVVDRLSKDESHEIIGRYPQVRMISEPPETGLVCGYAAGAKVATKEHLFFINEDMWFEPDCLRRLEQAIDLPNRIGAADPWQWLYDGSQWIHGGVRFAQARWEMNSPYPLRRNAFTVPLKNGEVIAFPCAGAVMIHRQMYDEVGGWPEDFFLDMEDLDMGIRAWQRGWKFVTVPEAKVYHAVGMSNAQTIVTTKQKVNARRYISGRSSLGIICLKYFSLPDILWCGAGMVLVTFANDLVKGRFDRLKLDWGVVREIIRRSHAALEYRRKNASLNRQKPGQAFFTDPAFTMPNTNKPDGSKEKHPVAQPEGA